jgi:hypothetical protein
VLGDRAGASMRAEPRVVMDRVVAEERGDRLGVAGVERLVVAADVFEQRADVGASLDPRRAVIALSLR